MTETTFGKRLQAARKSAGHKTQEALGDLLGVSGRTVRNWETDAYPVPLEYRDRLMDLLGRGLFAEGDPVEAAVRASRLTEDRQYVVLGTYKRQLREQDEEQGRGQTA